MYLYTYAYVNINEYLDECKFIKVNIFIDFYGFRSTELKFCHFNMLTLE